MIWQTWGDWPQNLTKFGIIGANQTIGQIQMGFASHLDFAQNERYDGIKRSLSFILLYDEIYYISEAYMKWRGNCQKKVRRFGPQTGNRTVTIKTGTLIFRHGIKGWGERNKKG